MGLFTKMFGTRSEREVKALNATVDRIEALEEEYRALSDHDRPSLAQPLPLLDPASSELRCRRGSDTSDGDDLSIGASPPPNLTEYRVRDFSDRFLPLPSEKELAALQEKAGDDTSDNAGNNTEKAVDKSEPFSWQSVLKDLK